MDAILEQRLIELETRLSFQEQALAELSEALGALDPDAMSPRDALEALYQLKRMAREPGQ